MRELSESEKSFILQWGEMGSKWGINRTVAQIHALLMLSEDPLHAEEITETLSVSRSNVSNGLQELQQWELVEKVQKMGDRRDYYTTYEDLWKMFRVVIAERKRRELDPLLENLTGCISDAKTDDTPEYARERMQELKSFLDQGADICEQIQDMPPERIKQLVNMWDNVKSMLF